MEPTVTLRIESTLENVRMLSRALRAVCEELGADAKELDEVELGIDEIATNIVEHGYGGARGRWLSVELSRVPGGIELEIEDDGLPIPAERRRPQSPGDDVEVALRGRGLFIVSRVMELVGYETSGGRNRLRVRKRFGVTAPS